MSDDAEDLPEDETLDGVEEPEVEEDEPEPEPEAEPEPEEEPEAPAPRKSSRAAERIRAQQAENKREKERSEALERELRDLKAREAASRDYQRQAQEREQLERMTPEERTWHQHQAMVQDIARRQAALEASQKDIADQQVFERELTSKPHLRKFESDVRKMKEDLAREGRTVDRLVLLDVAIGRAVRERGDKAAAKQGKAAQARVAAAKGTPGRRPSGSGSSGGRSLADKLDNVLI